MPFPQYRIPIERLKEEWALRLRMERLRRKRAANPENPLIRTSRIPDNNEPWISNSSSVAEFLEIARKVNETVEPWAPRQDPSSKR